MDRVGIRDGDELAIIVYRNGNRSGEVTIHAIAKDEVVAAVYTDDEDHLIVLYEAIKASLGAVKYHLEKPTLRKLLDQRIAEFKEIIAKEEREDPPSPADGRFPF